MNLGKSMKSTTPYLDQFLNQMNMQQNLTKTQIEQNLLSQMKDGPSIHGKEIDAMCAPDMQVVDFQNKLLNKDFTNREALALANEVRFLRAKVNSLENRCAMVPLLEKRIQQQETKLLQMELKLAALYEEMKNNNQSSAKQEEQEKPRLVKAAKSESNYLKFLNDKVEQDMLKDEEQQ